MDQKDLIAYIEKTYQGVSTPDEDPEIDDYSTDTGSNSGKIDIDDEDDDLLDFDPDTGVGSARPGKMQTTLRKIYMSLWKAGISKEAIGKLPEFKGKNLGNLSSNPIRISTKRAAELEVMADQGTISYSTKER